ncbi:MAG: hypothetical protein ABIB93_00615 [Chloroflexota bacterium]
MLQPEEGVTYGLGLVTVRVSVSNFDLGPDDGKIIYYLDVDPPTTAGQSAKTATGSVVSTNRDSSWESVSAGEHTFSAQLVNADETPLSPPVFVTVNAKTAAGGDACD